MQRTIRLLLNPTVEQKSILLDTLMHHAACFNAVAAYGFEHGEKNGVDLHKATYYPLRAEHPTLPAQLVCAARVKATEAIKSALTLKRKGRKVSPPHSEQPAIRYDARTYRVLPDHSAVSLSTTGGRQVFAVRIPDFFKPAFDAATGFDSADLIKRKGRFWLHVVVSLLKVEFVNGGQVVGIDLGLKRPAVLSNNLFLGQRQWREVDARYFRLRRALQSKGTRSAKRHLKRLGGKLLRFRRDCDHVLSKRMVQSVAPGTTLVFENLNDIRRRVRQRHGAQNRRLHSWSYRQLRVYTTYKAEAKGVRVIAVDPRNSSKMCSRCGHLHRLNRRSQSEFRCRACGYQTNADRNAALNLAQRGMSAPSALLSESVSCQVAPKRDLGASARLLAESI